MQVIAQQEREAQCMNQNISGSEEVASQLFNLNTTEKLVN